MRPALHHSICFFQDFGGIRLHGRNRDPLRNMFVFLCLCACIPHSLASDGKAPSVSMLSENSNTVGLYEKYEIVLGLENADFFNPFNPDEIDIRALMISPSGREWRIFGFYDNVQNRDRWLMRFSPNETGIWRYTLEATDSDGTGTSSEYTFEAVPSPYHGWVRVSGDNPHYLAHDDGTSFYGVGPYYPWGVSNGTGGLAGLESSGANFFGYWNIPYGNEGNILESVSSGLGRYDQPKCGRIDQLIEWAEQRGLVMMFAIWPHDLLSNTVWAHLWHLNPYNQITSVLDFYDDAEAWEYQEKQYRYLIARWGYSRGLGIWEIVNEINGTDGWQMGKRAEATGWVGRVHAFFKVNDPYGRPTTASMSGGQYWPEGYSRVDLPNVHLYETDWIGKYPGNPLRSSLWTYHDVSMQMWKDFEKPAIMGEAGYLNTYGGYAAPSDDYTSLFHNALWASWAGGLAVTPVWWAYNSKDIMSAEVMLEMKRFSLVARLLDYAHSTVEHAYAELAGGDAMGMAGDTLAFGWVREAYGMNVSSRIFRLDGLADGTYRVRWIDPWSSATVAEHGRISDGGILMDELPLLGTARPDLAFFVQPGPSGGSPVRLLFMTFAGTLLNLPTETAGMTCLVLDAQDRVCTDTPVEIDFTLEGGGTLVGSHPVIAAGGKAEIVYQAGEVPGPVRITASSPGLEGDTLTFRVANWMVLDDFEDYTAQAVLDAAWQNLSGTDVRIALETGEVGEGAQSMRVTYAIGNGSPPYTGISKSVEKDYGAAKYFSFWLKSDGSNRMLTLLLHEQGGRVWQYDLVLGTRNPGMISIPLADFRSNSGGGVVTLSSLKEIGFNIQKGNGEWGQGTIFLDLIEFGASPVSALLPAASCGIPDGFVLWPVYPNPFNDEAVLTYSLPLETEIRITALNITGETVAVLYQGKTEPGTHSIRWRPGALSSGIYFLSFSTNGWKAMVKCLMVR